MPDHNGSSPHLPRPVPDRPLGHSGELSMRQRLPGSLTWDERSLTAMMSPQIGTALARFIEMQPFFFIATASAEGHCDASFRGREFDAFGRALPALRILSPQLIVFPDYPGNGLYNSLGNILVNPHIGMLFMDFQRQRRARVNGLAEIGEMNAEIAALWPDAQAAVFVTVEQAFGNCPARIPRMTMAENSDSAIS